MNRDARVTFGVCISNGDRFVGRAVVNYVDFEILKRLPKNAVQAFAQKLRAVIGWDADGYEGVHGVMSFEDLRQRLKRLLSRF